MNLMRTAKGSTPFKHQRLTAVMLMFLLLFFIGHIIKYHDAPRQELLQWLHSPAVASIMILTILAAFYQSFLGLKMVVDDYIHAKNLRWATLFVLGFVHLFLITMSILLIVMF
jgi:succinate dehydrogenase / fumarate reductase membrane anchor subunit